MLALVKEDKLYDTSKHPVQKKPSRLISLILITMY